MCSNNKCIIKTLKGKGLLLNMVTRMGFEPMYAAVKGRCVKPLHQRASL